MLLTDDFSKRWEEIVDQVDKQHIPITLVKKVVFRMQDKRQKTINLRRMRDQAVDPDVIEQLVDSFIQNNEQHIASMEFILDIEAVAGQVQPETDKLLKELE